MESSERNLRHIDLEVNGYTFNAIATGPVDAELVLFLHGFPQFADSWVEIMHTTADAGFHAVAVDQRGYSPGARPSRVKDYSVDHLGSDTLGFADKLGATRLHLVGHDWGGLLAWQFAAKYPDRLLSLTVLSTPHPNAFWTALQTDKDQQERSQYLQLFRLPGIAEAALLGENAQRLRDVLRGKLTDNAVDEMVRRLSEDNTITSALNWYRAADFKSPSLEHITTPTLYLWGTQDQALGESAAVATEKFVTAPYRFERLEGKSHWLLEDSTEQVIKSLLEHLQTNRASSQ